MCNESDAIDVSSFCLIPVSSVITAKRKTMIRVICARREEFGGSVQQESMKNQSEVNAMPSCTNKISHGESLLQCHMCSQQGFTAIGLKVFSILLSYYTIVHIRKTL